MWPCIESLLGSPIDTIGFIRAFLSSLNNNYHKHAYYRQEVITSLPISTLYGT